ncbi:MAG: hypothetical protein AMXMBFR33_55660 [Candidatus Xenobia bacterium]
MNTGEVRLFPVVSRAAGQASPGRPVQSQDPADQLELSGGAGPESPRRSTSGKLLSTAWSSLGSLLGWPVVGLASPEAEKPHAHLQPPPEQTADPLVEGSQPASAQDQVKSLLRQEDVQQLRQGMQALTDDPDYGPACRLALQAADEIPGNFGKSIALKAALVQPRMGTPAELAELARSMLGFNCEGAGPVVMARLAEASPEWAPACQCAVDLARNAGSAGLVVYQTALKHLDARTPEQQLALGQAVLAELEKQQSTLGDAGPMARAAVGEALMGVLARLPGGAAAAELALRAARATSYESSQAAVYAAVLEHPRVGTSSDLSLIARKCLSSETYGDEHARVLVEEMGRRPGLQNGARLVLSLWPRCRRTETRVALARAFLEQPGLDTPRDLVRLAHTFLSRAGERYYGGVREEQSSLGREFLTLLEGQAQTSQAAHQGLDDLATTTGVNEKVQVVQSALIAASLSMEVPPEVRELIASLSPDGRAKFLAGLPGAPELTAQNYLHYAWNQLDKASPSDRALVGRLTLPQLASPESEFLQRLCPSVSPEQQVAWFEQLRQHTPPSQEPDPGLRLVDFARELLTTRRDEPDALRGVLVRCLARSIHLYDPEGLAHSQLSLEETLSLVRQAALQAIEVRHLDQGERLTGLREENDSVRLPGVRLRKKG